MATHRERILDQFTRQAVPFSTAPGIRDEQSLQLLVEAVGPRPEDTMLDVACGPGLVVCAFAPHVRHATGIDLTPAMLDRARQVAAERGVTNVSWQAGDVVPLPFPAGAFSIVTSRFAFHHFQEPGAALGEMRRVCGPGGAVLLADIAASPDPARADAFNRMECLRDPSHVRALPLAELEALFPRAGLPAPTPSFFHLESDLEGVLSRSFPDPRDLPEIRRVFEDAVHDDAIGMNVRRVGDRIRFAYPIAVLVARVPEVV